MNKFNDQDKNLEDGIIDFKDIVKAVISHKLLITLLTSFFAIASVCYSLSLPNIYTSKAILSVVDDSSSSSNGLSQFSGIAAFAGVSLPSSSNGSKKYLAIETLKSRDFFSHLITHEFVLPGLVAYRAYDLESKKISWNNSIYNDSTKEWTLEKPSFQQAYMTYSNALNIVEDIKSGFITISVKHISPEFAFNFLELIINELNLISRQRDIEESNRSLLYLYQQLETTIQSDIKKSINSLIESQLKIQMLANIKEEYLLSKLDKPYIPEKKSSPSRARLCIMGTIFGLFLSLIISISRYFIFSTKYI
jgi:hypothetical protein|tara:strand:- start:1771 stop:2691 length:921 start_codon:yes stop_codon:yes gene_type:complete